MICSDFSSGGEAHQASAPVAVPSQQRAPLPRLDGSNGRSLLTHNGITKVLLAPKGIGVNKRRRVWL
jgi:hypothetical protein